jgi:hypothetical protein
MYVIIVIGSAKQGKTPFIKKFCEGKNLLVFDVQNEYGKKVKYTGQNPYGLTENNNLKRSRFIEIDKNRFIEACEKKRNTVCVFEEATIFFEGRTDDKMRRLLFSKAHTNNTYILVFHSVNSVPPRIMESCDYIVLFKTNDEQSKIKNKYNRLLPYFNELKNKKDGSKIIIKSM